MNKLTRHLAIDIIVKIKFLHLNSVEKENILVDILSENDEYLLVKGPNESKFNTPIINFLKIAFKGVTNQYLCEVIRELLHIEVEVVGKIEQLNICPCCGYKTLDSIGNYDICSLCLWEDDGGYPSDLERYSTVNSATLSEAKKCFFAKKKIFLEEIKYLLAQDTNKNVD